MVYVDLRGQGRSSERASHFADFGYREMVEIDLPAAIAALRGRYPNRPLLLVGHSLGGQLATLPLTLDQPDVSGRIQQVSRLPIGSLAAGTYDLRVVLSDGRQQIARSTTFRIVE